MQLVAHAGSSSGDQAALYQHRVSVNIDSLRFKLGAKQPVDGLDIVVGIKGLTGLR